LIDATLWNRSPRLFGISKQDTKREAWSSLWDMTIILEAPIRRRNDDHQRKGYAIVDRYNA
jgi:hypothetical protein